MGAVFEKEYEVNYYNVDARGNLKLTSIADFFCDIGFHQSAELGESIEKLTKDNMAWVFYKYDIQIVKYPRLGEKLKVFTEAVGMNRFYAYRQYKIVSASGEVLVRAKGIFLLIDLVKRRAIRVPEDKEVLYKCKGEKGFDLENIKKKFESQFSKEFAVRYSDIDTNGHVNNTRYMEWSLELVPRDIILNYTMDRIKVNFLKEVQYGHKVHVEAMVENVEDKVIIRTRVMNEEEVILALCETEWHKN